MNSQPNSDVVNSLHSHLYKFPQLNAAKSDKKSVCSTYMNKSELNDPVVLKLN